MKGKFFKIHQYSTAVITYQRSDVIIKISPFFGSSPTRCDDKPTSDTFLRAMAIEQVIQFGGFVSAKNVYLGIKYKIAY